MPNDPDSRVPATAPVGDAPIHGAAKPTISIPVAALLRTAVILGAVLVLGAMWLFGWRPRVSPFGYAGWSLALMFLVTLVVSGRANPLSLALGADNRLSTSKFQFLVWTGVAIYSYVLLWSTRALENVRPDHLTALDSLPQNLLIAMGFSVTTAVGAKAITVAYLNSGQVDKPASTASATQSTAGLVTKDDLRTPDLMKIQMLMWTIVAVVVYVARLIAVRPEFVSCGAGAAPCVFPDIDQSFMVLMGLSQGAYLGGKLTQRDTSQ